ncbi:hypothetical protein Runsl_3289 [Runella slithyformis DSM 19594]|uniref:Uncharacterized protein n=1 Tax=Runella slithyformis (strain ATCC 29530 / DSM 19594 / LMG 11500 / NCIMB 11436 / LSU 4) TaxID=761193 RepID=A0A7U4E6Z8_RUNSL|nr:hypothetical protein Runsl_3289 [Runella slithyformis DSM 19594]
MPDSRYVHSRVYQFKHTLPAACPVNNSDFRESSYLIAAYNEKSAVKTPLKTERQRQSGRGNLQSFLSKSVFEWRRDNRLSIR